MDKISKKNKWIAGILNFLLPGLGYIYGNKKRKFYAWALFVLSIWVAVHDWEEIVQIVTLQKTLSEHFLLFIILYPVVFAWDAYKDAAE